MKISSIIGMSLAFAALAAVPAVLADILFLQVNGPEYDDEYSGRPGEAVRFDYATVKVGGSSDYLCYYNAAGSKTDYYQLYSLDEARSATDARYFGDFDSGAVGYFTVELWNESGTGGSDTRVGWQRYAIGSLSDYIWTPGKSGGATALVVDSVIPEPSSGLLLLVGGALLALRRRRA